MSVYFVLCTDSIIRNMRGRIHIRHIDLIFCTIYLHQEFGEINDIRSDILDTNYFPSLN